MFGRNKTRGSSVSGVPARSVKLVQDQSGAPAVDLTKVRAAGKVDLAKRAEKAGLALSRHDLAGLRAEGVLLIDHSWSMERAYRSGQVQTITERALGFGLQIDADGQVPVIRFDSGASLATTATVDNYQGIVSREIHKPARMGSTNLAAGLRLVLEMARAATSPLYVLIVTDGEPNSQPETDAVLVELSHYPVFVTILATTEYARTYLEHLDHDLPGRFIDNIDAKFLTDPDALTDLEFADALADEWRSWIAAAQNVGLLT
jgi:Mg-chelatase subunit ChlD